MHLKKKKQKKNSNNNTFTQTHNFFSLEILDSVRILSLSHDKGKGFSLQNLVTFGDQQNVFEKTTFLKNQFFVTQN